MNNIFQSSKVFYSDQISASKEFVQIVLQNILVETSVSK